MFANIFSDQLQSKISLKIVIGGDCFRLPKLPQNFSELEEIVRSKFENKLPENFCFKYEDSDNDSINVESTSDYEAFLEYCSQEKLRTIKLRIDSKSYKQYFNWLDQFQQIGGVQSLNPQSIQMQIQAQQNNGAGFLMNPYNTYYQNLQRGQKNNSSNIYPPFSFEQQAYGGGGALAGINPMMYNDQNSNLMQLIMGQQVLNGNSSLRGSVATNNQGNLGMATGNINNSNINFNTTAGNNSVSSQQQIPSLSKGTSEVNANENVYPYNKKQSANQSYSGMMEQNMSFANQTERRNTNITQSGGNNINNNYAQSSIKQSLSKNAAQNIQISVPMQVSQQYQSQDLNQTSKFYTQESQVNMSQKQGGNSFNIMMTNDDIENPMIDTSETPDKERSSNLKIPTNQAIKRTNSMSCGIDDALNPILSNQASFMPIEQIQVNNNYSNAKNSQNLRQNELTSSNISNIDTRSQTTGGIGNLGSNYSANNFNHLQAPPFGVRINQQLSLSQYTNQGGVSREPSDLNAKEGYSNFQDETSENEFIGNKNITRELSPSPPLSQNTTLANSTNLLNQSKMLGRPSIISTLRSGQNMQVPCEKCMIWDEEQKNNPSKSNDKIDKTPTSSNTVKEITPFATNPDCDKCSGTGYLKIEDPHIYNVIQAVIRHKLKEAEITLKSLQVRQSKVEKIIPKDSMDWLQKILQNNDKNNNNIKQIQKFEEPLLSPFTPVQQQIKNKDLPLTPNTLSNLISKNIHLVTCFECKNDISQIKYIYLCIDCKSKNGKNAEVFSKKMQDEIDFDNILCEQCEEGHNNSHRVVQICKEDIMTMHSTNQQPQTNQQVPSTAATPLQRPTNLFEKSLRGIANPTFPVVQGQGNVQASQNHQPNYIRQSEPKRTISFTQSTGGFNFPQSSIMTAPKNFYNNYNTNINNNNNNNNNNINYNNQQSQLETSTHFSFIPSHIQLQQQQSIVQASFPQSQQAQQGTQQMRQDISQRNSVEVDTLGLQLLQKMRSKSDNKSHTTIVKNSSKQEQTDYFGEQSKETRDDNNFPSDRIDLGRCSTNLNSFKNQIKSPQFNAEQISSITANFNNEDDPPTFFDSQKFNLATIESDKIIKQFQDSSANIISSPVVSQHPLVTGQPSQLVSEETVNSIVLNPSTIVGITIEKIDDFQEERVTKSQINLFQSSPDSSQNISYQKLSNTTDLVLSDTKPVPPTSSISNSNGVNSVCIKSQMVVNKLLQSSYQPNRGSLASSIAKDDRMQYRAKLVNSYCSNDILQDDSVIVFQEILNNGTENWPENVYLKCISGITDNCQYPVIQVNKGEMMSIAFPIKIGQYQANDGEQIKTAWRLYHQQQNEERKFFGPKITIDFQYKKPKRVEQEVESLEFLIQNSITTMKNIFNKDSPADIGEFIKQNQQIAEEYLIDKKEDVTISKLIIKYIEQYVTSRNNKQSLEKSQE